MQKKTDMEQVQKLAISFLYLEVTLTELSPVIVQHPFTQSGMVGVMDKEKKLRVANIAESEEELEIWRNQLRGVISRIETPKELCSLITKPYLLAFIKYAQRYMSKSDLSELLGAAWPSIEQSNLDPNFTKAQLVALFKKCNPKDLMDKTEYQVYTGLPDVTTVYRGVTSYNKNNIKALSWTTNIETAKWFAQRYDENGTVYQATIEKQHILAYFDGRNEDEVIINPKYLQDIKKLT